ncbi:hypothetical protein MCEMSEM23_02598 [Rhabdaerophilaceae bacterium]
MLTPIAAEHFSDAVDLLAEGFPERGRAFWSEGLTLIAGWPGNIVANFPAGFLWLSKGVPVGVLLTPASSRPGLGDRVLVNLSSWYLRPDFRALAPMMLRAVCRDQRAMFTDLTPTQDVRAMLPAFGFHQINSGISLQPTPLLALRPSARVKLRSWRYEDPIDSAAPDPDIIRFHQDRGCIALVIDEGSSGCLVMFKPFVFRGLASAKAVYVGSHAAMANAMPAIARRLLKRGVLLVQTDPRPGMPPPFWFRSRGLWFAKGGMFDDRTDHVGSELCLLDL